MGDVETTSKATPPGRKMLKTMEATRNNFYVFKTKPDDVVPRLSGRSGGFIDLNGDNGLSVDPRDAIWEKIRKTKNVPSASESDATTTGRNTEAPGSKLRTLKDALEPKMRQKRKEGLSKRYEMWQQEQGGRKKAQKEKEEEPIIDMSNNAEEDDGDVVAVGSGDEDAGTNQAVSGKEDVNAPGYRSFSEILRSESKEGDSEKDKSPPGDADGSTGDLNVTDGEKVADTSNGNDGVKKPFDSFLKPSAYLCNRSRSADDFFFFPSLTETSPVKTHETPEHNRSNTSGRNDSIITARKLLSRVISPGDSQPPTSQDILNACSGQFIMDGSPCQGRGLVDAESTKICSTPTTSGRTPRLFYDIFGATPRRRATVLFPSEAGKSDEVREDAPPVSEPVDSATENQNESVPADVEDEQVAVVRKNRNRLLSEDEDGFESAFNKEDDESEQSDVDDEELAEEENDELEASEDEQPNGAENDDDEEEALAQLERERLKFFDDEAELSGSDDGREDDNEDEAGKDEWEPEAGDLDEVPSEDELRSQIGRVHWKQQMDEDKRRLLQYKEAYLRNGDTDGQAMRFRFRWKRDNAEDDDDDFGNDERYADGENITHEGDELDEEWQDSLRQRAKWLSKHGMPVEDALAEVDDVFKNSQLFAAAQVALRRPVPTTPTAAEDGLAQSASTGLPIMQRSVSEMGARSLFFRRESLLKRGATILEKLTGDKGNGGSVAVRAKTSSVFTVLSPKKNQINESSKDKRASSGETVSAPTVLKKRKLIKEESQSVFKNLM